jgi:hypothetical protein
MGFKFQSIASVSSLLAKNPSIDYTEIGSLIGLYMFPGIVMALPSGLLSKTFGNGRIACFDSLPIEQVNKLTRLLSTIF